MRGKKKQKKQRKAPKNQATNAEAKRPPIKIGTRRTLPQGGGIGVSNTYEAWQLGGEKARKKN